MTNDIIAQAAQQMLANHDAFLRGEPCDRAMDRRVTLAACYASEALAHSLCMGSGTHAMVRAFLLALIDPLHPDLDYLRADPASGPMERDRRHPDAAILHAEQQAEAAAERAEEDRADG